MKTVFSTYQQCHFSNNWKPWIIVLLCWALWPGVALYAQSDTLPVTIRPKDRAGLQDPTLARIKTSAVEFAEALSPVFNGTVSLQVDDEIMYPLNRYENQNIYAERFAARAADYDRDVAVARARPQLRSDLVGSAFILAVRQMSGEGLAMQVRFKVKLPAIEGLSVEEQSKLENDLAAAGEKAAAGGNGGLAVAKGIDAMRVELEELAQFEIVQEVAPTVNPCNQDWAHPGGAYYYLPTGELVQIGVAIKPSFADNSATFSPLGSLAGFELQGSGEKFVALMDVRKLNNHIRFMGYYSDQVIEGSGYRNQDGKFNTGKDSYEDVLAKLESGKFKGYSPVSGPQSVSVELKENDIVLTYNWQGYDLSGITDKNVRRGTKVIPEVYVTSQCIFCDNKPGPGRAFYNEKIGKARTDLERTYICRLAQLFNKVGDQFAQNKNFVDDAYWRAKMAQYYDGICDPLNPLTFEESLYKFMEWYVSFFQGLEARPADELAFEYSLLYQSEVIIADIEWELRLKILLELMKNKDHILEYFLPHNENAIILLFQNINRDKTKFLEAVLKPEIIDKLLLEFDDVFDGTNYFKFVQAFMQLYTEYILKQNNSSKLLTHFYNGRPIVLGSFTIPSFCLSNRTSPICKQIAINALIGKSMKFTITYPLPLKREGMGVSGYWCTCNGGAIDVTFASPVTIVPYYPVGEIPEFGISAEDAYKGGVRFAPAFVLKYLSDKTINQNRKDAVKLALTTLDIVATIYGVKALTIFNQLHDLEQVVAIYQITRVTSQAFEEVGGEAIAENLFQDPADAQNFLAAWDAFNTTLAVGEAVYSLPVIITAFHNMRAAWKARRKAASDLKEAEAKLAKATDEHIEQIEIKLGLKNEVINNLPKALRENQLFLNRLADNPKLVNFINNLSEQGKIALSQNIDDWIKLYDARIPLRSGNASEAVRILGGNLESPKIYNGANYVETLTTSQATKFNNIVNSTTDVAQISKNLGISENVVQVMKQHLFISEHLIEIAPGTYVKGRFATFEHIADWWNAVASGNLAKASDLKKLIAHEYIEAKLMQEGLIYRTLEFPTAAKYGAHELSSHEDFFNFDHWSTFGRNVPPIQLDPNLGNIDYIVNEIKTLEGL